MSVRKPIRAILEISSYIRTLPPELKRRIHKALDQIRMLPDEGKPLQRELSGYRSYRVGTFRIIYRVTVREIELIAVGPRRTIYEEAVKLTEMQSEKKP